jgi:Zn ribbon nucleic-acid-binding protein
MYPIPPTEKLVDTKTCRQCHDTFPITDKDLKFYENVSPVFGGKKYFVPTPTLCPDCRQQRRLAWRNERKLYKRKCDATGRDIISVFSPDKTYKVYHQDVWASDQWNPMDYGVKFDFERPFFEQFDELMHQVPQQGIMNVNCENSTYAQVVNGKNCYLMFVGGNAENILYSYWMVNAKNSVDCLRCQDIEESYDCIYCYDHCFSLTACFESKSSSYCSFCWSIVGCKDCFMSGNIINKQYYFRNVQLSKEQYEMEM